jgi:hypothetical protein
MLRDIYICNITFFLRLKRCVAAFENPGVSVFYSLSAYALVLPVFCSL